MAYDQGNYGQARALFEESLAFRRELGSKRLIVEILAALSGLAATTGQIEPAARLAGAVEALCRVVGSVLDSVEQKLHDTAVNAARAQFDAATFDALWAEGQAMTIEQAIDYALEASDGDGGRETTDGGRWAIVCRLSSIVHRHIGSNCDAPAHAVYWGRHYPCAKEVSHGDRCATIYAADALERG